MSLHRRNAKRDTNENEIVDALEQIGVLVQRISVKDFADLICFGPSEPDGLHVLRLLEIKNQAGKDRISKGQQQNHARWPVYVVRSVAESLAVFGVQA